MTSKLSDSQVLKYFEKTLRSFIEKQLSNTKDWWKKTIPNEIRVQAEEDQKRVAKINDVLNKSNYSVIEYVRFDGYERIITRKDNWKSHFKAVFVNERVFKYKMDVIRSLRNDIQHNRELNYINKLRFRLHCYDVLSQIYESENKTQKQIDAMIKKLDLDTDR